jgi:hypothetical protein
VENSILQRYHWAVGVAVLLLATMAPFKAEAQEKSNWSAVIEAAKKRRKVVVYGTSSFRQILDKAKPVF